MGARDGGGGACVQNARVHGVARLIEVVRVKTIPWRQVEAVGEFTGG